MARRNRINVIGAGLAGCEASWQAALSGIDVTLYDMKPKKLSPAHKSGDFAELVCSNSFKAKRTNSAAGLLKEEMRRLSSLLLKCAESCEVEAGGALAVDRDLFAGLVTQEIHSNPIIEVVHEEITDLPQEGINIIATGPLTSTPLARSIENRFGASLSFYDAAAPIVTKESIDMSNAFFASRYGRGSDGAYINCPMQKDEYELFYNELINARSAKLHSFDKPGKSVYEGCMPVEAMAKRGKDTLRFGPLKPVGLTNPRTGMRAYAVVQLRKENKEGTMYNMVGFQTNLTFLEQKRVFSLIPALKNADFIRYGVMHRNTFLDSPRVLDADFSVKADKDLFFAGQITGVEGYMESAASGIVAGINAARRLEGREPLVLPSITMIGALSRYISDESICNFQPMGANFGIMPALNEHIKSKQERYEKIALRSLEAYNDLDMG